MESALFPTRRSDGTAEVAATFAAESRLHVERALTAWLEQRGSELATEFARSPYLQADGDDVAVVFPVRTGAQRWKDYMVEATREAKGAGGQFLGFVDRITGKPHGE